MIKICLFLLALISTLTLFKSKSYAQTKNFAEVAPSTTTIAYYTLLGNTNQQSSANAGSVLNPANASIGNSTSPPAALTANYFNLLGIANAEGEAAIQLKYGSQLPAGKTTYIPFDQPTVTGLLNLDLLAIVGDLTGLLSKNLVQFEAYSGATASSSGTLIAPANVTSSIVRDAAGRNYFAVTSASPYNSVRVKLRYTSSLLGLSLGATLNMNVYTAFNYTDDNCGTSVFTNIGEAPGLNVSLTTLVTNPERAIDNNTTTFSQIQSGLIGLGSSVSQTIYLNGLSSAGDVAKVVLSQPGTVLTLNLLNTITLQAYNGNTLVGGVQSVGNLINLQLLTGAGVNTPFPVYFTPGGAFDRIKITINNTLAVGGNILSGGLNVHEVQRTVTKPLFAGITGNALSICGGSTLALSGQTANPAYTYNFYKKTSNVTTKVAGPGANTYTETGLAAGTYVYYISAQKSGCLAESDRDSVVVTVKPTLVFTATTLTNASAGKPYSRQINAATGGTPGYTYALAAGSTLPAGITISPAGLISGTPTTAGTSNFSLTVTDSFGCITTTSFTLNVTAALVLPTAILPTGTVGTAYPSTLLPSPSGGTTPYTYTAVNMPPGLTVNPSTGAITGTPTLSGTYTFPVTLTDADGNTISTDFTILVRDPLALAGATLSDGTTGQTYPSQIIPSATGGSGVYTYTATNLPAGLNFNPATREITGTPTQAGTFTFPVSVADNEGRTASANYTVTIKSPLVLGSIALPDGTVGINYPAQTIPAASGGTGPYTYAAVNVPPGLSFDPVTRQISGVPTQSGTFTISVTVTDNAGTSVTTPYTLRVTGTLNLAAATLPDGTVGTSYTAPALPAVTGGTAPYIYTMTGLPAGLNFDPATRVISGTPGTGGNFTVTMSASDNGGLTTSTDYALRINVSVPVVGGVTICSGNTATLSVDNPVAGVTYNFYSATGNTLLGSGVTYTTPALTQTTSFFAEAVSGSAVSARTQVTVTVNPTPALPAVITSNLTISSGQTATLQASAEPSATIRWYANPTGGTPLGSGTSFTTPVLTATTTYYAGTENSSGCTSVSRVPVVVSVISGPVVASCNAAGSQQSNITGLLCVACSIQTPTGSIDTDPATYTEIRLTAGVGSTGYQRLIFQRTGLATDSIRLDLETPTGLADLGLLGGTTINVMNGNTIVRSIPLNNSLVSLSLLNGNRFNATVLAGATYDRVEVSYGQLVSAISSLRIYGAQIILPNPTIVSGNQTICSGSTASLSATAMGGTTLTWYSLPAGGTVLANGGTYTTPALTATTTYYIEVSTNGCPNPTRIPVVVTVTPVVANPVLATVAPVCAGSPAVLAVASPQAGTTYRWYTAATGGTPVFTDSVFVTPALTASTTYYVEAANGNCISPGRTAANITVNPRPLLPQLQASATTVSQGQTVSLTATSTESNVVFNWYTTADGTTPVFTGPNYVTPPLTATTTYYVDATSSATGCASSARVQITITVNGTGTPVPVLCELPVSQTNGVSGTLSLLARIDNPTLSIDADQQTASTLSIPVGINASVFQKVNFTGLSNAGDTVRVRLTATNQLLSLSLLSGITVTTFQGATSNNDGVALNNGIINIQLLNGGAEALLNLVPAAQFDGLEVRLNSGILGALSAVNFNYARRITTAPIVLADTVTTCVNTTATLTVPTPLPGIVYKWYDSTGNYLGNDGSTFVTPVITANTRFFVEASRGGCGGSRTTVTVLTTPAPLQPALISATEQTCQNANLLLQVQSPQAGVTYQWYLNNVAITGAVNSTYAITTIQTNGDYSVEAINSCGTVSARSTVAVTVGSLTAPVLNPLAITINSGEQTILTASSSTADLTYTWYTTDPSVPGAVAVSTAGNGANGTYITPNLTATTTYYVTAQSNTVGGCLSPASNIVVTVNPMPTNPGSVPCEPATTQSVRTGGTLQALGGVANPLLAIDDDVETSSSLFIPFGINSFVAQKVGFTGLSMAGDTVRIRLSSPSGGLTAAVGSSITLTTYNGTTSNGDEQTIASSAVNLQLLGGGTSAIINFVPAQTFDGVEVKLNSGLLGALSSVNFNYARRILLAPAVAAASVTVCEGSQANLAVANPAAPATGITYRWYLDNNLVASTASYQTPASLTAGTYNYFVSASRNGCESAKTAVTLTVLGIPAAPVPTPSNPTNTCRNVPVTLSVVPVSGVSYNWYDAATGGNLLAGNTNSYTTPAGLALDTTYYYVEALNGNSCSGNSARTRIAIVVNPEATDADLAVAGAATPYCAGAPATLTASSTTVLNPVFTWYTDAALSNAVFTGPVFNIASVTGTTTYYVTVRGTNKCENTAGTARQVTLQVNPTSTAADVTISGIPASICAGTAVTLTASTTTVTNPVFTWYSDAALTTALFTGPVYTTGPLVGNTNYYVTVQGSDKCPNTAANAKVIMLSVNPPATAADISVNGVPTDVCSASGVTLTASSTTVINPVFTWYTDAALTNAVFTGAVYNTPSVNGTITYYVTVRGDNKCENISGTGRAVVLNANPVLSFSGSALPAATVPVPYAVQINSATGGTPGYTYIVASGNTLPPGLSLASGGQLFGVPLIAGNYTFAITATDSRGCNATATFTLNVGSVGVMILPPAILHDGEVGTPYAPETLPAPIGGVGPYTYVATNVPPGFVFDPVTRQLSGTPTLGGTFTFTVTVTDANGLTATTNYVVIVTVPAPVVANAESCNGNSVTLTVTNPVANVTYNWYASAFGGSVLGSGTTFQTPAITATTTYYAEGTSGSARSSRTPVTVTLKPSATANDITITGVPSTICSGSGVTLTATAAGVTNPVFTWYTDNALTNAVFTGNTYTLTNVTANATYFVTVRGDNRCENPAGTGSAVTLSVNPALIFSGATLPNASLAAAYSVQISPATGGTPAYTYAVPAGSTLPAGLTLSAGGVISGTPTVAGLYTFALSVTDSRGCTTTANFSITVDAVIPPVTIPAPVVTGTTACGGSSATLTVTNPVAGVTYNWYTVATGGTSIASGTSFQTPAITANTTYYVEGTNGTATSTRTAVNVTLGTPATSSDIIITGEPAAAICAGSAVTLTASSTTVTNPVFTWYTDANLSNPVYTGNVYTVNSIAANTTYYVTVRGDNRCENAAGTARVVTITVNPPLNFSTTTLPAATASGAYSAQLNPATGGTPGYTYTISSGSTLPAGMSLSSGGLITGTPSVPGNYTFSVTATDSRGCNATATFTLTVSGTVMVLPPATLPDGLVGTIYTPQTLPAVIGGTGPYTYVATGLPPGLTFNPVTREITGTPTLGGTFTVTVTVTDATGATATATYSITVNVPAPVVADGQSCDGTGVTLMVSNAVTGVTYNWYSTATGGSILFTGTSYQTPALTANTTYYVQGVSGTASSSRIAAAVTVLGKLATPVVTRQSSTFTSITFSWNTIAGAAAYEVSRDGGSTWVTPSSGPTGITHLIIGLQANEAVTLMVRARGLSGCQTSNAGTYTAKANGGAGEDPTTDDIFIPNTFTPNGDGNNDIFFAYGSIMADAKMRIYDQWGHVIFISQQMQYGWDGTYRGQPQPNGVYVYIIDILKKDGTRVMKKGTVTLLK